MKKKKNKNKFLKRPVRVVWHSKTGIIRKYIDCCILGQWAYHTELLKSTGYVVVLHVHSGFVVHRTKTKKEAIILCKRLHTKNKHIWMPNYDGLISFARFHQETKQNLIKYAGKRTRFAFDINNFNIEDLENDIPF